MGRAGGRPLLRPAKNFGLEDIADALAALIEHVGLGPAHVAGLSWGGTVVLELYHRHPELVATLVLLDTYAGWKGSLPPERSGSARCSRPPDARSTAGGIRPTLPGLFAGDPPAELLPCSPPSPRMSAPPPLGNN